MIIAGIYSFNGGKEIIEAKFTAEFREVEQVIATVDSLVYKTKVSKEKTMPGRMLYEPRSLNRAFRAEFSARGWLKYKVFCEYPTQYYTLAIYPPRLLKVLSERWIS